MDQDKLIITVDLKTGLIRTTTSEISAANHANAEDFVKYLGRLAGGETTSTPRTKHGHTHAHEQAREKA